MLGHSATDFVSWGAVAPALRASVEDTAPYGKLPIAGVAVCLLVLSGCSVAYMEKNGKRYIFGPTLVRDIEAGTTALDASSEIVSVGLSAIESDDGFAFSLGWVRWRTARLRTCSVEQALAKRESDALPAPAPSRLVFYERRDGAAMPDVPADAVMQIQTVGLAVAGLGEEIELRLGYADTSSVSFGPEVLICGNPVAQLKHRFSQ